MPDGRTVGSKLRSRHGPVGSGLMALPTSVPASTLRRSSGQALLGSAVGSPGLATVTTNVQRCGALCTRCVISAARKSAPFAFNWSGDTASGCAVGTKDQRTAWSSPAALVKMKLLRLLYRSCAYEAVHGALPAHPTHVP